MKKAFLFFLTLLTVSFSYSQNLVGKWTGYFKFDGGKNQNPFTIEFLESKGKLVAFTHTKFKVEKQQFYSVCSAKIKVLKDNFGIKIIVTEYKFHKGNSPRLFRGCFQKHTLLLTNTGKADLLKGFWESANNINTCGSGSTFLERDSESKAVPQANVDQN
jgi:hypothetical protein